MRFTNEQTIPLRLMRREAEPETVYALVPHLDPNDLTNWTCTIEGEELRFVFAYGDDRVGFALMIDEDEQMGYLDDAERIVPVPYDELPSDLTEYKTTLLGKK